MKILDYIFSDGNMKIGKIWNISHTPIKGCMPGVPCACAGGCYALKSYTQYPATRKAWDNNFAALLLDAARGFPVLQEAVTKLFAKTHPAFFRIHVAGDFLNQRHVNAWKMIAAKFSTTNFLAFTKRYDLKFDRLPPNLSVKLSVWPNWPELKEEEVVPDTGVAWLRDEANPDGRIPATAFECPGSCQKCKYCWINPGGVVFDKH